MNFTEDFSLTFSYSPYFLILGILLIIAYSIFIYRTTLPEISLIPKVILVSLRSVALLFILLLIFDPLIKTTSSIDQEPKTLIFIDNSKSIAEFSDTTDISQIHKIVSDIDENFEDNSSIFLFGKRAKEFDGNKIEKSSFDESTTYFGSVIEKINNFDHLSSVVIISDGIINQGSNPEYEVADLGIPFYTIGIGDTSSYSDVSVESIRSNPTIYTNRESEIEILIKSQNIGNENLTVQLYDNQKMSMSKSIRVSESGVNRVTFPYLSSEAGLHEIRALVSVNKSEKNLLNNSRSTLINVLDSKKKILVIAGSPSRDLSAILNSLQSNEEYEISRIIEVGNNQYYNGQSEFDEIEKSDVIFLIGFPTDQSNEELTERVFSAISNGKKGVFYTINLSTDSSVLKKYSDILPFQFDTQLSELVDVQITAGISFSRLLGNRNNIIRGWEELPPVNLPINKIMLLGQSEIILTDSELNRPVLFSSNYSGNRNIVLLAINSWRWKLMAPNKELRLYDNLILNSAKWLGLESEDYFNVALNKNEFKLGEDIIFTANAYDYTFQPLNNQQINLKLSNDTLTQEYSFTEIENGMYESRVQLNTPGIYNYTAEIAGDANIKPVNGTFKIDPVEIELITSKMNQNLLNNIAQNSGGEFYNIDYTDDLLRALKSNYQDKIYSDKIDKELRLSNFELILFIIVILLSFEWIIRKYLRMI